MFARCLGFFRRHPVLRDVVIWSVPALLFGAVLRMLLLSAQPFAYWGSDSKSYYSFAHQLLAHGDISLDEKRRYLYPLLMLPVSVLPGAPLKWLAWLQHALGLLAVLPIGYVVRKSFVAWRWWIIPVTIAFTGFPILLWYEHELLGETLFFTALAWAFGGWVAWVSAKDPARARALFWWFFVPLAVFLLTKPSGRFLLPGLALGFLIVRAWRVLQWKHWLALILLCAATLTVGSKKQGAWLLYVATFPLTQLDTPLHGDYKAEIRDYARPFIDDIDVYYRVDKRERDGRPAPFDFLDSPSEENAPPLWAALDKQPEKKRALYMDLALEGIRARPLGFLYLGWQRLVASANLSKFNDERFTSGYYPEKLKELYEDAVDLRARGKSTSLPMAFGLPRTGALPPLSELVPRLTPRPNRWPERWLTAWVRGVHRVCDLLVMPEPAPDAPAASWSVWNARVTPLGWWLAASLLLSAIYARTLGVWVLAGCSYLFLVFLVSLVNIRYFAPVWIVFLPILAVPLDLFVRICTGRKSVG